MRYVVAVLDPDEQGLPLELVRQYDALPRARDQEYTWQAFDHASVLTAWDDPWGDPMVAEQDGLLAVGVVRLDNRKEVERWTGLDRATLESLTDLALVLRVVAETGTKRIRDLLGDFAFAVWHPKTRTTIAATDALGVRKLFYTERDGRVAFATRAEALVLEERYEVQYLAELIALCSLTPGLTVFAGVRRLPAATFAVQGRTGLTEHAYWRPEQFETLPFTTMLEIEAPEVFRELFAESIKQRLGSAGQTWSQLSGGLDSSSIVSMSQWLLERGEIPHGLAGTVSFVDYQGTDSDEREYSNAVASHWRIRNDTIVESPLFFEEDGDPPHLDSPGGYLAFVPRERRLAKIVGDAGGRVVLTGFGSDELLTGDMVHFADRLARGHFWSTGRDLAVWAAQGRTSFWKLAYGNALQPLVPHGLRRPAKYDEGRLFPWISPGPARRYALARRTQTRTGGHGRLGCMYRDTLVSRYAAIATQLNPGWISDVFDTRCPFLARPLVEFALQLPPQLCARPHRRKWVLREGMRGILPDVVRTRVGKGATTDLLVHAMANRSARLVPLLIAPILADLGLIDVHQLRVAFETAPRSLQSDRNLAADVQATLMTEAWLRIRADRWPPGHSSQYQETPALALK